MKRTRDLTARQRAIYEFIRQMIRTRGYGPTVREIGDEFGINSPNGVVCHLRALEKKGSITRQASMSRSIQLAKEGPASLPLAGALLPGQPIDEADEPQHVDFSRVFAGKDTVALRVGPGGAAQSGLIEGDLVVIEKRSTAKNGQTVVAVLPDGQAVLRAYAREKARVRLDALAGRAKPIYAKKVKLLGVVVAAVRQYE